MIHNVQALRGFAAMLVVLAHLRELFDCAGLAFGWSAAGYAGVDVFFAISGFIMVHTALRTETRAGDFFLRRLARVVPLYWAMTLAVYGIAVVAPSMLASTTSDPVQLLESLLFVPFAKADGGVAPVLYVGWTLNFEMMFYALFALGLTLPRRWTVPASAACLAALVAVGQIFHPKAVIPGFYTDPVLLEFVWGMLLGLLYPHLPTRSSRPLALLAGLAVVCGVGLACWTASHNTFRSVEVGLPAAVAVLGCLVLERMGFAAKNAVAALLGDVSYAVYLTHPFVAAIVVKLALKAGVSGLPQVLAVTAVTFAACAAAGWVVHTALEKPLTQRATAAVRRAVAASA